MLAVAVSGGPDSIALLVRLARRHPPSQLIVLTVDHALRPSSQLEAANVAAFARSLGVEHHTLLVPWGRPPFPPRPPPHSTEAPARQARLLLFRQFMGARRIEELWMGHHRDDQVENRLLWGRGMRRVGSLPRAEGVRDLDDFDVVRPLLGVDKTELIKMCNDERLPFFIDPTNLDPSHTPRNHLRAEIAAFQSRHWVHPNRFRTTTSADELDPGGPIALLRRIVKKEANSTLNDDPPIQSKEQLPFLSCVLTPSSLPPSASPAMQRAYLKHLIKHIGPSHGRSISTDNLEQARRLIWDYSAPSLVTCTPGGGVLLTRQKGGWLFSRQPFRRTENFGRVTLRANGEWRMWDGRVWLRCSIREGGEVETGWSVEGSGKRCAPVLVKGERRVAMMGVKGDGPRQGEWTDGEIALEWDWRR